MIAEAMKELVANSSAIRAMFEEGKALAEKYGADNVFDFSLGNPSVSPPKEIEGAISDILRTEDANLIHGYMSNAGYPDVRERIAASINNKQGTNYNESNIIMTTGAAGAMNIIFKTLLNPGDEVVVFAPFFGEYRRYIENFGGKLVVVPADTEAFQLDLDSLSKSIGPRTKAVIINSPNNPSGVVVTKDTLQKLAGLLSGFAQQYGPIYLVSDEPYREIVFDGVDVPYIPHFYQNTLVAYSYSKSLSLPGERIGYIAAPSELEDFPQVMAGLACANRVLGFVNSPSLFQRVVARCADVKVDVSVYEENRDLLYNGLTEMGYHCVKPQGAFYLFPRTPVADDAAFCQAAKKHNILVVPGRAFGCPGHFRIAYCVPKNRVVNALPGFKELL